MPGARPHEDGERPADAPLLRAVADHLPCAFVVLHRDGTTLAVSSGARRLLYPDKGLEPAGPVARAVAAALGGQPAQRVPLELGTPSGTVDADFLPVGDGVLVRLDVCTSAQEQRCFFQYSRDLLAVADHEGVFLRLSPSWSDSLGWSTEELVGHPFLGLVHPADRDATRRAADRLSQHKEVIQFENRYRCRDGTYRWLQWNAVSPPGAPIYAVARDVTDQRNAMAQLHAAYEALHDAEQRRLRLFQHVVHDLATPLSTMGLQLALLASGPHSEEVARLRKVHEHLKRLIDDVRDLSLAESQQLRLQREPTPAHDLLGPTLEALRDAAAARGIELHSRVEDVVLDVDPLRFNQIVYNLVTNAIKFTPEHGRVDVHATHRDGRVLLTVADTGHGLDDDEARRLFQPFVQLHTERVTERGSGLGLFICKQLTEAHGGRIWVESSGRGQGSRFHVELPAA